MPMRDTDTAPMMPADDPEGKRAYSREPIAPPPPLSGAELRAWRKRRRLSQGAAATKLGISLRQLQRYENDELPPAPTIAALCAALDEIDSLKARRTPGLQRRKKNLR